MAERLASVLLVDNPTGRMAAVAQEYARSPLVGRILAVSGNGLIRFNTFGKSVETFPQMRPDDVKNIVKLALFKKIDLADVLQDESIAVGVTNALREQGIPTVGPSRGAGKVEWDKLHGRRFMERNGMPIPDYIPFFRPRLAKLFLENLPKETAMVVKANGLAGGKGVVVANNISEALAGVDFVSGLPRGAGNTILLEEKVGGARAGEFSAFYLGRYERGKQYFDRLGFARDYKRAYDGDRGPNTGSMGSVSYPNLISPLLQRRVRREVVDPHSRGFINTNTPYRGVLYIGLMYDPDSEELWVIEDNARWGDPEAEVLVPNIGENNDMFELSMLVAQDPNLGNSVPKLDVKLDNKARVAVAICSKGYPNDYAKVIGGKVEGLREVIKRREVTVFGAGIMEDNGDFIVSGGRIAMIMGEGDTVKKARQKVYEAISRLHIRGERPGEDLIHYRTDIAAL